MLNVLVVCTERFLEMRNEVEVETVIGFVPRG